MVRSIIKALLENDMKKATTTLRKFFLSEASVEKTIDVQEFFKLVVRDIDRDDVQAFANRMYGYLSDIEDYYVKEKQYIAIDKDTRNQLSPARRVNMDPVKKQKLIAKHRENSDKWNHDIDVMDNRVTAIKDELRRFGAKFSVNYIESSGGELEIHIDDDYDPKSGTTEVISADDFLQVILDIEKEYALKSPGYHVGGMMQSMSNWFADAQKHMNSVYNGTHSYIPSPKDKRYTDLVRDTYIKGTNDYLEARMDNVPEVTNMFLRGWSTTSDGQLYVEVEYP